MKLTSTAFEHNGTMNPKHTCDGIDTNPPLAISDVPETATSLVLIMDDPDAMKPAGKVWDHWIVYNIDPSTTEIAEGQEPKGDLGQGTRKQGYQGPCPPDAEHGYIFKLYALNTMLQFDSVPTKPDVERAMEGYIIEQAELVGRYNRQ